MDLRFVYRNVSIDYSLLLEDRKTISATVFPTRAVLVKAPCEATDERIYEFLKRKFRWVLKQQRYFAQFRSATEKRYVSGESFRYMGRTYKLLVRKDRHNERVSLQHGTLTVRTNSPKNRKYVERLVEGWYTTRMKKIFADRLAVCFQLFDYDLIPAISPRKLKKRWGSYIEKSHRIILNRQLIRATGRHIDYVIIHELCHITHKRHTRAFFTLLESVLPEWEKLKTELELSLLG